MQGIKMFKLLIYYSSVIIVLILFWQNCTVLYHISKLVLKKVSLLLPTLNHTLLPPAPLVCVCVCVYYYYC